jgi:hypothetical protein
MALRRERRKLLETVVRGYRSRMASDDAGNSTEPQSDQRTVRFCPYCGEVIGSFWGKSEADGAKWCESCQVFFSVTEE